MQELNFSTAFWDQYFKAYHDDTVHHAAVDDAGLGRGWAGYTEASYESAAPGPDMPRRGIACSRPSITTSCMSPDCSSHRDAFADWKGPFLGIAHSIDFFPAYHQMTNGNYRNFTV